MGSIINATVVVIGSAIGLLLKKGVGEKYEKAIMIALGISVLILGLNGVISSMATVVDGVISTDGTIILIVSLVIGVIIGEWLKIDDRLNGLGDALEKKFKLGNFSQGFVTATLIFCVGAMSIVGSLNDGISGDSSIIMVKSMLDGISSVILTAAMGIGVMFSAVPILLYQCGITLLASYISPLLSTELLNQICMVGYAMVICIGINFLNLTKIKTANFLPALLVPPVITLVSSLF